MKDKPRIKRFSHRGEWECRSHGAIGIGWSPWEAFRRWESNVLTILCNASRAKRA
jgi:hypothetical protein